MSSPSTKRPMATLQSPSWTQSQPHKPAFGGFFHQSLPVADGQAPLLLQSSSFLPRAKLQSFIPSSFLLFDFSTFRPFELNTFILTFDVGRSKIDVRRSLALSPVPRFAPSTLCPLRPAPCAPRLICSPYTVYLIPYTFPSSLVTCYSSLFTIHHLPFTIPPFPLYP